MAADEIPNERLLARFAAALEEYAIVVLDPAGRVLSWNAGAERITGYRAGQIVGVSIGMLYPPEDVERGQPQRCLADAVALERLRFESWLLRADGSRFWGDVVITAIYGPARELCGFGQVVRDATRSREFQRELMRQALHDSLTGLPNRALLLDRMRKAMARLERQPGTVAVLFIDLDRFKVVNDTLGHQAGDRVLLEVSRRLRAALRTQDTVARLSGDEFVVLCELGQDGTAQVQHIAERLAAALAEPVLLGDRSVALGAAVGVVVTGCATQGPEKLLGQADAAMYEAKTAPGAGLVRVVFSEPRGKP